jgi:serine/threonine protein kinase
MNERFIRCAHCGLPHEEGATVCPKTGKPIERLPSRPLAPTRNLPVDASRAGPPSRKAPPPPPLQSSASVTTAPGAGRRDLIGRTIGGKYNVRAVLGEGGMGTVFEALNLAVGRQVAIKVLHTNQLRKKDSVRRFHQEARAAGAIGHPNICEVYDLGTLEDGCPYLVMEKLVGETLADRIGNEGGLPIDDVLDILTQVLSGLVAAHEKGIVHRDIKPENVFLTRRVGCAPVAKLLDFGVSKMIPLHPREKDESGEDMTRTGIVLGTPYYLAPEQARGDRNLDARVDLYACGVMLYEALTGKRPFTAQNYNALLIHILTGKPKAARDLRPALPRAFDRVLDKAMAREPSDRYQSAVEMQTDLQQLMGRISGAAMPLSVRTPASVPPKAQETRQAPPSEPKEEKALRTTRRRRAAQSSSSVEFTVPPAVPPRARGPAEVNLAPARRLSDPSSSAPAPGSLPAPASVRSPSRQPPPLPPPRPSQHGPASQPPSSRSPASRPPPPLPPPPLPPRLPPLPVAARIQAGGRRKVVQGFDDMPTDVEPPGSIPSFSQDTTDREDARALLRDADVRRFVTSAARRAGNPADPQLVDDSKTDVMSDELKKALLKASERPPRSGR